MSSREAQRRKHLRRIPVWLPERQPVVYFLTVCCASKRRIFTEKSAVRIAASSLIRIGKRYCWQIHNVCFMPDHVHIHMLLSPIGDRERSLSAFVQAWKSSVTLRLRARGLTGRIWQPEFFDRLLRSDESAQEKWRYIELNPVRAGLADAADQYPYSGTPEEILKRL